MLSAAPPAARRLRSARRLVAAATLAVCVLAPAMFAPALALPDAELARILAPIPAFGAGLYAGTAGDAVVLALLALSLAAVVAAPSRWQAGADRCAAGASLLLALRAVPDLKLWQPYLLQFGALLWLTRRAGRTDEAGGRRGLELLRLVLAGVYFWSGFAKAHAAYLSGGGPFFLAQWTEGLPTAAVVAVAAIAPAAEMALALGLLWSPTRRLASFGLMAMHVIILTELGPLGVAYNAVVWPWNLAMMALLWLLRAPPPNGTDAGRPPAAALAGVAFLFWLAPALSYGGWWPANLSFRLYADRAVQGYLLVDDDALARLHPSLRADFTEYPSPGFRGHVKLSLWAEEELGAQVPNEAAVHRVLAHRILAPTGGRGAALILVGPPHWWTGERPQRQLRYDELSGR